jgi:hypothetical protein
MRRLDTLTCQGCHHARAVAGFHLLGDERDPSARMSAGRRRSMAAAVCCLGPTRPLLGPIGCRRPRRRGSRTAGRRRSASMTFVTPPGSDSSTVAPTSEVWPS